MRVHNLTAGTHEGDDKTLTAGAGPSTRPQGAGESDSTRRTATVAAAWPAGADRPPITRMRACHTSGT